MVTQVENIKKLNGVDGSSALNSNSFVRVDNDMTKNGSIFSKAGYGFNKNEAPEQSKKAEGGSLLSKVFHAGSETKAQDNISKAGSTNANNLVDRLKEFGTKLNLTANQTQQKVTADNKKIEKLDKENEKISKEITQKKSEESEKSEESQKTQEGPDLSDPNSLTLAGSADSSNSNSTGNSFNNNTSKSSSKESGNNSEIKSLENKLNSNNKQIKSTEKGSKAYINSLANQAAMIKKAAAAGATDAANGKSGANTASTIGKTTSTVGGLASATGGTLMAIPDVSGATKALGAKLMIGGTAATVAGSGTQAIAAGANKDWDGAANASIAAMNTASSTFDKSDKLKKIINEQKNVG